MHMGETMELHKVLLEREQKFVDRDGKPIRVGSYVHLVEVPASLLEDLPIKDKRAIQKAAKHPLLVSGLMTEFVLDNIELEFIDDEGAIHWIYVAGKHLHG